MTAREREIREAAARWRARKRVEPHPGDAPRSMRLDELRARGLEPAPEPPKREHRRGPRPTDPVERFWSYVDKQPEGCWLWSGGTYNGHGYGAFYAGGRTRSAHRVSYEIEHGVELRRDQMIDHACREKLCVRPDHLRIVTHKENAENLSSRHRRGGPARGVSRSADGFYARVRHNRRQSVAGPYDTAEEAAEVARGMRLALFTHNEEDRARE